MAMTIEVQGIKDVINDENPQVFALLFSIFLEFNFRNMKMFFRNPKKFLMKPLICKTKKDLKIMKGGKKNRKPTPLQSIRGKCPMARCLL